MEMSESDICMEYRQAKNRKAQIRILADQNCCSLRTIKEILAKNGYDVETHPKKQMVEVETRVIQHRMNAQARLRFALMDAYKEARR